MNQLFEQALADHPTAETYADFGSLLLALGRTVEAAIAYRKAIGLKPDYATAHFNLGQALEEMHETIAAKGHYSLAAELQPDKPLWQLRALICAPVVFDSAEEIGAYREGVKKLVEEWNNNSPSPPAPLPQAGEGGNSPSAPRHLPERSREIGDMIQHTPHAPRDEIHQAERDEYGLADGTGTVPATLDEILEAGAVPSFGLAYHGRDQRRLKEQFAALYEPYFRDQPLPVGSGNRDRPRIGILVTRRHEGMFLQSMRGIIEQLDGERFEPVILCSRAILKTLQSRVRREGLRFVPFGDSLRDAIEQVRVAACDLIYYWEVGTDALNYFLPFARLAPVQCTGWATMTSGVPAVDWFFSSALVESPGSQEQYTERLWQSRTLFRYQDRAWPTPPATRGEFGLPEGRRLYLCFQNPLKLHPNIDPLLDGILKADPQALVVLLADRFGRAAESLRQRFARTINAADRIVFLPPQDFVNYCRLLQLADVVIDPPHYGANSSCYDIFSYNLPLVTTPGKLFVGRVTQAFYRKMGVDDLVVHSPQEYVSKAVQVATDRDYRKYVTERIANNSDVLFNDLEAVREHERFFEEAVRHAK